MTNTKAPQPTEQQILEILEQLQAGTLYADNTEPAMTNNRNIATKALLRIVREAQVSELNLFFTGLMINPSPQANRIGEIVKARIEALAAEGKG